MTDHTLEVNFEVKAQAGAEGAQLSAAAVLIRDMVVDRMANALLDGRLGADPTADANARVDARAVYVMTLAMLQAMAELGLLNLSMTGD